MKKLLTLFFVLMFAFLLTSAAQAETVLFEDFEDEVGFTTGGGHAYYWGIADLGGIPAVPSYYTTGGNQDGKIFYGSFAKDFSDLSATPIMTIDVPDLSSYENLKMTVSLASPDCTVSTCFEITHRDRVEVLADSTLLDKFLPVGNASPLRSLNSGRDLHYDFQDYEYDIDDSVNTLTFIFASTAHDETVGIDSVEITGIPKLVLTDKEQCKKGGWELFTEYEFKNQGECVSYVQKNKNANKVNECGALTICGDTCTHDDITYGTVLADDNKCWLDRNLGAIQAATAYNDGDAYGWIFQWGRNADGHQIPTSGTIREVYDTDDPGHSLFIKASPPPCGTCDWRVPQNDNLWQGVDGINNPCPSGFRVPTQQEWVTLVSSESITNYTTAFDSALKLTAGGYRGPTSGTYEGQGNVGYYWTSTPISYVAYLFKLAPTYVGTSQGYQRTVGFSVRCIQD